MLIPKYLFKTSIIFNKKTNVTLLRYRVDYGKKTHDKRTMRNRCNKFEIFKIDNDSIFFRPSLSRFRKAGTSAMNQKSLGDANAV